MYSPKIREEHIPILYRMAKDRGKPMTHVVDEILSRALQEYHARINNDQEDRHPRMGKNQY